jgi:acyl-CoA thioesterase FadM
MARAKNGGVMKNERLVATEYVASFAPFVVRRQVRWSECDPAGVVFAGNFSQYLHNAVSLFRNEVLAGYSAPAKAMSLVFHRALWPDEQFDMHVHIGAIGRSTIEFRVAATTLKGEPVFNGSVTAISIAKGVRKSVPLPPAKRRLAVAYAGKWPAPVFPPRDEAARTAVPSQAKAKKPARARTAGVRDRAKVRLNGARTNGAAKPR